MPTLLELVNDVRLRIADTGGDTGTIPTGFTYYWESDDSGCIWTNAEIVSALNWAHREIALRRPYRDSASFELCEISIYANTARYALDPRILSIEDVILASTGKSLIKTTLRDLRVWASAKFTEPGVDAWKTKTGTPAYYSEDVEPGKLALIPVPIATTDTLLLTVYRLPLELFEWQSRTYDLEEPPIQLQEALLQGALSRLYQKHDSDALDDRRYKIHEEQFNQLVGGPVDYQTLENRRWNANLDMSIVPAGYSRSRVRRTWMDDA